MPLDNTSSIWATVGVPRRRRHRRVLRHESSPMPTWLLQASTSNRRRSTSVSGGPAGPGVIHCPTAVTLRRDCARCRTASFLDERSSSAGDPRDPDVANAIACSDPALGRKQSRARGGRLRGHGGRSLRPGLGSMREMLPALRAVLSKGEPLRGRLCCSLVSAVGTATAVSRPSSKSRLHPARCRQREARVVALETAE
jgi:hypothetical protein